MGLMILDRRTLVNSKKIKVTADADTERRKDLEPDRKPEASEDASKIYEEYFRGVSRI